MRVAGVLLMFSGWLIALTSLAVLQADAMRLSFLSAGILVEVLGMALVAYAYRADALWESGR
jgi:hypothetical protein